MYVVDTRPDLARTFVDPERIEQLHLRARRFDRDDVRIHDVDRIDDIVEVGNSKCGCGFGSRRERPTGRCGRCRPPSRDRYSTPIEAAVILRGGRLHRSWMRASTCVRQRLRDSFKVLRLTAGPPASVAPDSANSSISRTEKSGQLFTSGLSQDRSAHAGPSKKKGFRACRCGERRTRRLVSGRPGTPDL
jgi:hypothetical protein